MKYLNKQAVVLIICVVAICVLCISTVSYAYFTTQIIGNDTAKEMIVETGDVEITYTDSNEVNVSELLPGDYITKTFKVTNTGTLEAKYNIKIDVDVNNFKDKQDLVYILTKDGAQQGEEKVLPYEDGYILTGETLTSKNDVHNYTLTIKFKKDNSNQNDNMNKKVQFKIEVDNKEGVNLYQYTEPLKNNFYNTMLVSEETLYDDYYNLRYFGENPANFVLFNCNDYASPSAETCELWRIIGIFKNVTKPNGEKEDLVKIVRNEITSAIEWDTGGKSYWPSSSLNEYFNGEGSTIINSVTREEKVENVRWNIGGSPDRPIAKDLYLYERGNENCVTTGGCPDEVRDVIWDGKVALIYPSDYVLATSGGNLGREQCLEYDSASWNADDYLTDCARKSWLLYEYPAAGGSALTRNYWTFTMRNEYGFAIFHVGPPVWTADVTTKKNARPSLYLKSSVAITSGDGTINNPFVIN